MEKTILILLMIFAVQSCGSLQNYNDPTSTKQIAWNKTAQDDRFYLNNFEVTKELYRSVKIGDQFKMTKHTYLGNIRTVRSIPTKEEKAN